MMKAEVSGNALEVSFSRGDVLSLVLSVALATLLLVLAGWEIAAVAIGMSLLGAGAVDLVQRSEDDRLG